MAILGRKLFIKKSGKRIRINNTTSRIIKIVILFKIFFKILMNKYESSRDNSRSRRSEENSKNITITMKAKRLFGSIKRGKII